MKTLGQLSTRLLSASEPPSCHDWKHFLSQVASQTLPSDLYPPLASIASEWIQIGVQKNYFFIKDSLDDESDLSLALGWFEKILLEINALGGDSKIALGKTWFITLFGWYAYIQSKGSRVQELGKCLLLNLVWQLI